MDSSFDRRHIHVQYFTRLMWVLRISASFETQLNCLWISKVLQSIENPEQRQGSFSIKKDVQCSMTKLEEVITVPSGI